jgi:hypothetical protein
MKARATIFSQKASDDGTYRTIGVLVLGRKLVFVAMNEEDHEAFGAPIEAAARAHKENGVTLDEIFDHYADKDLGQFEVWSKPINTEGKNEREVGEAILARAKYTDRVEVA